MIICMWFGLVGFDMIVEKEGDKNKISIVLQHNWVLEWSGYNSYLV